VFPAKDSPSQHMHIFHWEKVRENGREKEKEKEKDHLPS
jgi:hypothetical protein